MTVEAFETYCVYTPFDNRDKLHIRQNRTQEEGVISAVFYHLAMKQPPTTLNPEEFLGLKRAVQGLPDGTYPDWSNGNLSFRWEEEEDLFYFSLVNTSAWVAIEVDELKQLRKWMGLVSSHHGFLA